jgi:hypothetical protein
MLSTARVSVDNNATLLYTASGATKVAVYENGGAGFYLGPDNSLTAGNGFLKIGSSSPFTVELSDGATLYGFNDNGGAFTTVYLFASN